MNMEKHTAAPELLAACKALMADLLDKKGTKTEGMLTYRNINMINAAIARATEGGE